jgi:hypothetical protein
MPPPASASAPASLDFAVPACCPLVVLQHCVKLYAIAFYCGSCGGVIEDAPSGAARSVCAPADPRGQSQLSCIVPCPFLVSGAGEIGAPTAELLCAVVPPRADLGQGAPPRLSREPAPARRRPSSRQPGRLCFTPSAAARLPEQKCLRAARERRREHKRAKLRCRVKRERRHVCGPNRRRQPPAQPRPKRSRPGARRVAGRGRGSARVAVIHPVRCFRAASEKGLRMLVREGPEAAARASGQGLNVSQPHTRVGRSCVLS